VIAGCGSSPSTSSTSSENVESVDPTSPAPPSRVPGAGEVAGTVGGERVVVADAVAVFGVMSERDEARRGVRIALRDREGTCAAPDVVHPGERTLTLEIDGERDLVPGTYGMPEAFAGGPGITLRARLDGMGDACETKRVVALDGTVTLLEVDATRGGSGYVKGAFDLKLGRDRVSGSFVATGCARPSANANANANADQPRCAR
jgi:hypothetical protein